MENVRERFASIRAQLEQLGLFGGQTLVMLGAGEERTVLDAEGNEAGKAWFDGISAPAAVFTSGRYSRAYAAEGRPVRAFTDDMAQMFGGRVGCVETPAGDRPAFLIRDRGFVVTGRFDSELIAACILMEKMCMAAVLAPKLGGVKPLGGLLCSLEHRVYLKKYSRPAQQAAAGPAPVPAVAGDGVPDLALRQAVIEYGKRLVEDRLIQATWGNVSVRLDDGRFLITPSGVDYDRIRPEEVVEVRIADGGYPEGQHPSSERKLHRLVYEKQPDVRAVIHTHSACCQVFAACRRELKGSGVYYPCADYGVSGSGKLAENVARAMGEHDGCLMANHGFVAGGEDLQQALRRAVEAEALAKAQLEA